MLITGSHGFVGLWRFFSGRRTEFLLATSSMVDRIWADD